MSYWQAVDADDVKGIELWRRPVVTTGGVECWHRVGWCKYQAHPEGLRPRQALGTLEDLLITWQRASLSGGQAPLLIPIPWELWLNHLRKCYCIADLQCCVNFCCIAKIHFYTYIHIFFFIFLSMMVNHRILNYSSLCNKVVPCCFSILYTVIGTC